MDSLKDSLITQVARWEVDGTISTLLMAASRINNPVVAGLTLSKMPKILRAKWTNSSFWQQHWGVMSL